MSYNENYILVGFLILYIYILSSSKQCNKYYESFTEYLTAPSSPAIAGNFLISDSVGNLSTFGLGAGNTLISDSSGKINTIPTGKFNDGLSATTGVFSGALNANGSLNANGGVVATTGKFSGDLNADGGVVGTTGKFIGALNANGGVVATTGKFINALNADGGLTSTTGTLSGQLTANGGLKSTTGTFTGQLAADGGLKSTTATFTGDITGTKGTFTNDIVVNNGKGYSGLVGGGGGELAGYLNIFRENGTRKGYIGWDDKGYIQLASENGCPGYRTNGDLVVDGKLGNGVVKLDKGWSIDTSDGHLRFKYNGEQQFVVHNTASTSRVWSQDNQNAYGDGYYTNAFVKRSELNVIGGTVYYDGTVVKSTGDNDYAAANRYKF